MSGYNRHIEIQGTLAGDPEKLAEKLAKVRVLAFDWDGVFNSGEKGHYPSTYNEIDSMGINMLRFGYFLLKKLNPVCIIVTGERNDIAIRWAEREHFHAVFLKAKHKADILSILEDRYKVQREEILFVFDDIHDLSLAAAIGVRFLIPNAGARQFEAYCRKMNHCDYISKNPGGQFALREISESVLLLLGLFEKTVKHRIEFKGIYLDYWQKRNRTVTEILELDYGEGKNSKPQILKNEPDPEH